MNSHVDTLLKEIQDIASCLYLSDLPGVQFSIYDKFRISQIPEQRYDLKEWNDAVSYIVGIRCHCATVQDAKDTLMQRP